MGIQWLVARFGRNASPQQPHAKRALVLVQPVDVAPNDVGKPRVAPPLRGPAKSRWHEAVSERRVTRVDWSFSWPCGGTPRDIRARVAHHSLRPRPSLHAGVDTQARFGVPCALLGGQRSSAPSSCSCLNSRGGHCSCACCRTVDRRGWLRLASRAACRVGVRTACV